MMKIQNAPKQKTVFPAISIYAHTIIFNNETELKNFEVK